MQAGLWEIIIDFLYNWWLPIFVFLMSTLSMVIVITYYVMTTKIRTWLFILKTNTATSEIGKETPDGAKIRTKKRIVAKTTEPFVWKHGIHIERMFFVNDGQNETLQLKKEAQKHMKLSSSDWNTIFESEAIKQAMAVLAAEGRKTFINIIMGFLIGAPLGALAVMLIKG